MTPAARLSAAIEVLDEIGSGRAPADQVLKAWGKAHRFAGSKDRRAIAEHVYQALRARVRSAWRFGSESGRALVLGSVAEPEGLFSGQPHGPAPLTEAERAALARPLDDAPAWVQAGVSPWVAETLQAQFAETWVEEAAAIVLERAPVDLRVNALRGDVDAALRLLGHEGVEPARTPYSAWGLRLPAAFAADIQKTRAYETGWIEVQDEASQIAAALAGPEPGWTVVDYCAGGGGKTLALAAQMRGQGRLVACDVNRRRLGDIRERLERAGAGAEVRTIGPEGQGTEDLAARADLVVVDAPCSGSGTWRRKPEGAWRVGPEDVARLAELQAGVLARAAQLARPGGRLAYFTCSMFAAENEDQAARFSAGRPEFRPLAIANVATTPHLTDAARDRLAELAGSGHTVQLTPRRTGTDGFFIALFERSDAG